MVVVALVACGWYFDVWNWYIQASANGPTPTQATAAQLKSINRGYVIFCGMADRAPANLEEYAPYLVCTVIPQEVRDREEECLRQLRAGHYEMVWNQHGVLDAKQRSRIVTAYERRTVAVGGFVVFADERVRWMNPEELHQAIETGK